jgi:plastocyanin domain-containing protein
LTQGLPVEWRIDASLAAGCGRILIAPKARVRRMLPSGVTVVTFTPREPGDIRFNCGMGMMTRGSAITVLANAKEVKATIAESLKLAEALGINGTPSYVIGSDVVAGAVGLDALREKVSAVRK